MSTHIKKDRNTSFCGKTLYSHDVAFVDLQHYELSKDKCSSWGYPACKECVRAANENIL